MDPGTTALLAILAGMLVGFALGLVGGGGSILAVPLLAYLVGVDSPHMAIGTGAMAVALNAAAGLAGHARAGNVRWPCALVFSVAGVAGAAIGAEAGKAFDGERLLALFGVLMIVVGIAMIRRRADRAQDDVRMTRANAPAMLVRLGPIGFGVGLLAGFFGIGGGFLIVPGLILAVGLPITTAIGSSLVAVFALGATTAASYSLSGLIDWPLIPWLAAGGVLGSILGRRLHRRLGACRDLLQRGFGALVVAIGGWVALQGL